MRTKDCTTRPMRTGGDAGRNAYRTRRFDRHELPGAPPQRPLKYLVWAFCHASSRWSITALGTAITAQNGLSIFWKGVEPGTSIAGKVGLVSLPRVLPVWH